MTTAEEFAAREAPLRQRVEERQAEFEPAWTRILTEALEKE